MPDTLPDLFMRLFIRATTDTVDLQDASGDVPGLHVGAHTMPIWARAYLHDAADNPWAGDDRLLNAICRLGDFNASRLNAERGFLDGVGWDEWRLIAWLEAAQWLKDRIEPQRMTRWQDAWRVFAEHMRSISIHMDAFDGGIPNHGIWHHVVNYRIGQVVGADEYVSMARHAMDRVFEAQTPDGCWREGRGAAELAGTPVTLYNLVSGMAVDLYGRWSGDLQAAAALERAYDFWVAYMLPDGTNPPNFTFRRVGHTDGVVRGSMPAYYANQPEGRFIAEQGARQFLAQPDQIARSLHELRFIVLQYPGLERDVQAAQPTWTPGFRKMLGYEAGVRRRPPWTAHLCGITNVGISSTCMKRFGQERQDLISLHHEKLGMLVGSGHSKLHPELSTFTFFETGRAYYLHDEAYLKSTSVAESLVLRYGSNVGTASVQTDDPTRAKVTFSLHGELGRWPERGLGFPLSAQAAKAHLSLRLKAGMTVTLDGQTWTLEDDVTRPLHLSIEAGRTVSFGDWSLTADGPWSLRWPFVLVHAYQVEGPGDHVGLVETLLIPPPPNHTGHGPPRPTVCFTLSIAN